MALLDDLASALQTLADDIRAIDAGMAISVTEEATDKASTIGSNELTTTLVGIKDGVEHVRDLLSQAADGASNAAQEVRGMT